MRCMATWGWTRNGIPMVESFTEFVFSALLGIVLIVVVALLARREMVKYMKREADEDRERKRAAEAEQRGASDGPNQG